MHYTQAIDTLNQAIQAKLDLLGFRDVDSFLASLKQPAAQSMPDESAHLLRAIQVLHTKQAQANSTTTSQGVGNVFTSHGYNTTGEDFFADLEEETQKILRSGTQSRQELNQLLVIHQAVIEAAVNALNQEIEEGLGDVNHDDIGAFKASYRKNESLIAELEHNPNAAQRLERLRKKHAIAGELMTLVNLHSVLGRTGALMTTQPASEEAKVTEHVAMPKPEQANQGQSKATDQVMPKDLLPNNPVVINTEAAQPKTRQRALTVYQKKHFAELLQRHKFKDLAAFLTKYRKLTAKHRKLVQEKKKEMFVRPVLTELDGMSELARFAKDNLGIDPSLSDAEQPSASAAAVPVQAPVQQVVMSDPVALKRPVSLSAPVRLDEKQQKPKPVVRIHKAPVEIKPMTEDQALVLPQVKTERKTAETAKATGSLTSTKPVKSAWIADKSQGVDGSGHPATEPLHGLPLIAVSSALQAQHQDSEPVEHKHMSKQTLDTGAPKGQETVQAQALARFDAPSESRAVREQAEPVLEVKEKQEVAPEMKAMQPVLPKVSESASPHQNANAQSSLQLKSEAMMPSLSFNILAQFDWSKLFAGYSGSNRRNSLFRLQSDIKLPKPPAFVIPEGVHVLELQKAAKHFQHYATLYQRAPCAERSLAVLAVHFELQLLVCSPGYQEALKNSPELNARLLSKDLGGALLALLTKQLKVETLVDKRTQDKFNSLASSIQAAFSAPTDLDEDALESLIDEISAFQALIRPVDIDLLLSLVEATDHAAERIKNKHVVLLLGSTGAGKSTTIHFIAGSTLEMVKLQESGLEHIQPIEVPNDALHAFKTTPFARSETRFINAVDVTYRNSAGQEQTLTLCDTPGFGDTEGVELDIANGIGVVRAVQQCQSVKPLLLMSSSNVEGERMRAVAKLIAIMGKFMPSMPEHVDAFSYWFTKYEPRDLEKIHNLLRDLKRNLTREQKALKSFPVMLNNMISQTKSGAMIVDPLSDDRMRFLADLERKTAITNPGEQFRYFTTSESLSKLKEQVARDRDQVLKAIERGDFIYVTYKLDQHKLLQQHLELEEIKGLYEQMTTQLTQLSVQKKSGFAKAMAKFLQPENQSVDSDLNEARDHADYLCQLEQIRITHMPDAQSTNFVELVALSLVKGIVSLGDLIKQTPSESASLYVKVTKLVQAFKPIFARNPEFMGYLERYAMGLKTHLTNFFDQTIIEIKNNAEARQFAEMTLKMGLLLNMERCYGKQSLVSDLHNHFRDGYHQLVDELSRQISVMIKTVEYALKWAPENVQVPSERGVDKHELNALMRRIESIDLSKLEGDLTVLNQFFGVPELVKSHFETGVLESIWENAGKLVNNVLTVVHQQLLPQLWTMTQVHAFANMATVLSLAQTLHRSQPGLDAEFHRVFEVYRGYIEFHIKTINDVAALLERAEFGARLDIDFKAVQESALALSLAEKASAKLGSDTFLSAHRLGDSFAVLLEKVQARKPDLGVETLQSPPAVKSFLIAFEQLSQMAEAEAKIMPKPVLKPVIDTMYAELEACLEATAKQSAAAGFFANMAAVCQAINFLGLGCLHLKGDFNERFCSQWSAFQGEGGQLDKYLTQVKAELSQNFSVLISGSEAHKQRLESLTVFVERLSSLLGLKRTATQAIDAEVAELSLLENQLKNLANYWFDHNSGKLPALHAEFLRKAAALDAGESDALVTVEKESADALMVFDEAMPDGVKFALAYEKLKSAERARCDNQISELRINMQGRDGDNFVQLYQAMSTQQGEQPAMKTILQEYKNALQADVQQLSRIQEPLTLVDENEEANVERLVKLLHHIIRSDSLAKIIAKNEWRSIKMGAESVINQIHIKFEHLIPTLLGNKNLVKASSRLDALKHVQPLLAQINERELGREWFPKVDYAEKMREIEEQIQGSMRKREQKYVSLPLADYARQSPKQFLVDLERLSSRGEVFERTYNNTSDKIIAKIKQELIACQDKDPGFDIHKRYEIVQVALTHLPPQLAEKCEAEVKALGAFLAKIEDEQRAALRAFNATEQISAQVDTMHSAVAQRNYKYAIQISNAIIKKIEIAEKDLDDLLQAGKTSQAVQLINGAWQHWKYFRNKLSTMQVPRSYVDARRLVGSTVKKVSLFDQSTLDTVFDRILIKIGDALSALSLRVVAATKESNDSSFVAISDGLPVLRQLVEFFYQYDVEQAKVSSDLFSYVVEKSSFSKNRLQEQVEAIAVFLSTQTQKFNEVLKGTQLADLLSILTIMQAHVATVSSAHDFFNTREADYYYRKQCESVKATLQYGAMRTQFAKRLLELEKHACQDILHNRRATSPNGQDRRDLYLEIINAFVSLKSVRILAAHVDEKVADVTHLHSDSEAAIKRNLEVVQQEALMLLNDRMLRADGGTTNQDCSDFNTWTSNLALAIEVFQDESPAKEAKKLYNVIEQRVHDRCNEFGASCSEIAHQQDEFISMLLQLKQVSVYASCIKPRVDEQIDNVLAVVKQLNGARFLATLAIALNQYDGNDQYLAQGLIAEHDAFRNYAIELRNQKTLRFKASDVLDEMAADADNTAFDANILSEYYSIFEDTFWQLVESGLLKPDIQKTELVSTVRLMSQEGLSSWQEMAELVAHLFAFWTLDNTKEVRIIDEESKEDETKEDSGSKYDYLLQPHAAQVFSIFRLLGADSGHGVSDGIVNHLVQIGTGEGKSITLAVTATTLVLLGYEVDCACYSQYLSKRDFQDFVNFFRAFGVIDFIHYGTFNQLCEQLINKGGDIREHVIKQISGQKTGVVKKAPRPRPRIILIDEVDVFFSEEFYGNLYRPLAELRDDTVKALVSSVWEARADASALNLRRLKASQAYQQCLMRFRGWESLLEEALKALIIDVRSFGEQAYVVDKENDRIGYREQHGLSFQVRYRYKTLFAYFEACAKGEVTPSSRDAQISLLFDCGAYSYAELPKQYKAIMGVTGTLKTLSKPERHLLESEYAIHKFSYMPSVYGRSDNRLQFTEEGSSDIKIVSARDRFRELANEIKIRLGEGPDERAVMVFFESELDLQKFYKSGRLQETGLPNEQIKLISSVTRDVEKAGLIRQAANLGNVTLMSREFGRGTDFRPYDSRLNARGGAHVIQTFVSDQVSEETQIKGRTARQGEKGSYSMVLSEGGLDRFGLGREDISKIRRTGKFYSKINRARAKYFEQAYAENQRFVKQIEADHKRSLNFVDHLYKNRRAKVQAFLQERNQVNLTTKNSRTIVLMDATGSMHSSITKAKNTVKTMFERAYEILNDEGIQGAFELQFATYRNYDQKAEKLLSYSAWESDPENLRQYIDGVAAYGGGTGWWEEAIEIGLWYANQVAESGELDQVILIGDTPPNTEEQVIKARRDEHGEAYWAQTEHFKKPTFTSVEAASLSEKDIPVHCFFVHRRAQAGFSEIARITKGQCAFLDIESPTGADRLTELVTKRILSNLGGAANGERLESAYDKKFKNKGGYVSGSQAPSAMPSQAGFFSSQSGPAEAKDGESDRKRTGNSSMAIWCPNT